ncbi:MAG TPA: hypothetical protein VHA11_00265 [Bryobacteraceae bacterium]|nr:hypothetical protein [Bryobacteraceae bacterium]
MESLASRLQALWCRAMHPAPMWPVHGQYRCPLCMRSHRVAWDDPTPFEPVPLADAPAEQPQLGASQETAPATAIWR